MSQQRRAGHLGYLMDYSSQGRLLGGKGFEKGIKSLDKMLEGRKGKTENKKLNISPTTIPSSNSC